jgi:hypothetical protein
MSLYRCSGAKNGENEQDFISHQFFFTTLEVQATILPASKVSPNEASLLIR